MKKAVNVAQLVVYVQLLALLKPSQWKRQSVCQQEEHLYREEKYAAKYEINMLRCIFCGLCEGSLPKDAIYLSQTFAQANYSREGFIYKKEDLLIPHPKENPEAYAKALGERKKINN
jgi:NADH-quinone oxidoreductase subunit I